MCTRLRTLQKSVFSTITEIAYASVAEHTIYPKWVSRELGLEEAFNLINSGVSIG
jgi:hypothetical protein